MEQQIKYIIGYGPKLKVAPHSIKKKALINNNKEHVSFGFEIEAMLFDSKEEADQFIKTSLPNQRVRQLLNENSEYYESQEILCVKDVYYFDKRLPFELAELKTIHRNEDKILLETDTKIYTFGKITSSQKKQSSGYLGYHYVL